MNASAKPERIMAIAPRRKGPGAVIRVVREGNIQRMNRGCSISSKSLGASVQGTACLPLGPELVAEGQSPTEATSATTPVEIIDPVGRCCVGALTREDGGGAEPSGEDRRIRCHDGPGSTPPPPPEIWAPTQQRPTGGMTWSLNDTCYFDFASAPTRRCSLSRIIPVRSAAGRISNGPAFTRGCIDMSWIA